MSEDLLEPIRKRIASDNAEINRMQTRLAEEVTKSKALEAIIERAYSSAAMHLAWAVQFNVSQPDRATCPPGGLARAIHELAQRAEECRAREETARQRIAALEAENARLLGMGIDQATRLETLAQDPKEGERSAMREVRPETSASSEPLGSALSDDEIGSRIMNGLGGEKYDPSDLMPWERRVGKRARALFAKPAPVAVTSNEDLRALLQMASDVRIPEHHRGRLAEIISALSTPVSAEDVKRNLHRDWMVFAMSGEPNAQHLSFATGYRAALASIGIATEGT